MMYYNFKIILRNLRQGGMYSAINIGGLAIGMAACVLLLIWVYNQWSYDRFHPKARQIHQVWIRSDNNGQTECWMPTSLMIGPALKDEYPEVVESVRVSEPNTYHFGEGDRHLILKTLYVDPSFLSVFHFPLLQGNVQTALNDPYTIILTEKAARRLFGDEEPMGRTLLFDMEHPVTVSGVMKDLPDNTRFDFEILGPLQFMVNVRNAYGTPSWDTNTNYTYVELAPHAQIDKLNGSVGGIIRKHNQQSGWDAFLYPLDKSYLQGWFVNGVPSGGLIIFLRMFAFIAVFILLIACINFVNLSTARSSLRAKEVGVRKALGSRRAGLIGLFLSESILLAFVSGIIAFIIVHAALPDFSGWLGRAAGKTLSLDIFNIRFWLLAPAFILMTGLLAGAYPAFFLSAFRPVKVLKGFVKTESRITLRKVLVVLQFSFAIFLIIGALVVRRQITFAKNRDAGYDMTRLVHIPLPEKLADHYSAFRNDLMASGAVANMTRTVFAMTDFQATTYGVAWRGKEPDDRRTFHLYFADSNWAEMMGAELVVGRFPDPAIWPTDSSAILINETAAAMIGFDDPIGETLSFWGYEGRVTGVIKDFVLHSPFVKPEPMVIGGEKFGWRSHIHIRLLPGNTADKLASIESIYKQYNTGYPFHYQFVDDDYAAKFKEVQAIESLTEFFTVIAILISCMGLFSLVALTAERRRKEIGIRKVLGASVTNIILLISKEYLLLTVIAFAITSPLAFLVMHRFLEMFEYRTNIPVWLLVAVGALILLIALITVGFQAIKAATTNPVKSIMNGE